MITGLITYLKSQQSLSVLTSRIQPIPAPPDLSLYPLITYQGVSRVEGYTLTGADGVVTERWVFDCMADSNKAGSYGSARQIAETLANVLDGYEGMLPDSTQVFQIQIASVIDRWDDGSKLSCTSVHALIVFSR